MVTNGGEQRDKPLVASSTRAHDPHREFTQ